MFRIPLLMQFNHQLIDLVIFCQCFTSFIGCGFRFLFLLNSRLPHFKFQQLTYIFDLIVSRSLRSFNQKSPYRAWYQIRNGPQIFLLCCTCHLELSLNIFSPQIHYLLSEVQKPFYIKSLFHHSYQCLLRSWPTHSQWTLLSPMFIPHHFISAE